MQQQILNDCRKQGSAPYSIQNNSILRRLFMTGRVDIKKIENSILSNPNIKFGIIRPSVDKLIEENERRIERAQKLEPLFPEVRDTFIKGFEKIASKKPSFTTSFSHTSPNLSADKIFSMMLVDALDKIGFCAVCMCYDFAMPRADSAHVLNFASNIRSVKIFERDPDNVPYVFQSFSSDFKAFMSDDFVDRVVKRIKGTHIFNLLDEEEKNAYIKRLLELRNMFIKNIEYPPNEAVTRTFNDIFALLDIKNRFMHFDLFYDVIIDTLQVLYEKYGIYFIEILKKMDEKILLRRFDEGKRLCKVTEDEIDRKKPDVVFDLLRKRELHLTVPAFILAYSIAPTMPHMGGKDWAFYAYPIYKKICDVMGIEAYEELILNTYGTSMYYGSITLDNINIVDTSLWHAFPILYKDWMSLFNEGLLINVDLTSKKKK